MKNDWTTLFISILISNSLKSASPRLRYLYQSNKFYLQLYVVEQFAVIFILNAKSCCEMESVLKQIRNLSTFYQCCFRCCYLVVCFSEVCLLELKSIALSDKTLFFRIVVVIVTLWLIVHVTCIKPSTITSVHHIHFIHTVVSYKSDIKKEKLLQRCLYRYAQFAAKESPTANRV